MTRSNGILLAGDPSSKNVVRGNVHRGKNGRLWLKANANVTGNEGYTKQ